MQKKSTTPRKKSASKKQPTRVELRKQLAEYVAAILANPECPSNLHNAVGEATTEWTDALLEHESDSAPFIERTLNAYITKEEKRKGGTR